MYYSVKSTYTRIEEQKMENEMFCCWLLLGFISLSNSLLHISKALPVRYDVTSRFQYPSDKAFEATACSSKIQESPVWQTLLSKPRTRLHPHHQHLFEDDDSDFSRLGRVCCSCGVVSAKEFLETYAAAEAMEFPQQRIADLAAGHGLLAWFLLVLKKTVTSTVCVDRRMPASAETIAEAMREAFPHLKDRSTYIEADMNACDPHPSCLLVSVHACGTLTDQLLNMAMESGSSFAVVPCCHTIRPGVYQPHALTGLSWAEVATQVHERKQRISDKHLAVAQVVDDVRVQTMQAAGYSVTQVYLPASVTARNRLILGRPPKATILHESYKSKARSSFHIPLSNDSESIALCQQLSGKERAKERLVQQIPRHFSFTLALSLWLDQAEPMNLNASTLARMVNDEILLSRNKLRCHVTASVDGVHVKDNRTSQLFRFEYTRIDGGSMSGSPRLLAKQAHHELRGRLQDLSNSVLR